MLEWTSGVLQITVLILGIGALIATILLILLLRAGARRFNETVDRLATETKPLLANATAVVGDGRGVVATLRTDVVRVTDAAETLSEQLLAVASELTAGLRHPRPRRAPVPVDVDDED